MDVIPYSRPWLTQTEQTALVNLLRSGWLGQGAQTRKFENALSRWVGVEDGGVAVGSGSAALLLALWALEVGPGDEVILPSYLCTSVLEAVITSGARPVLCDVGKQWVVTAHNVAPFLNQKTKAIIVPHMYGIFADIASFRQFGVPIIEDSAQAIDYSGKRQAVGDIVIFSFRWSKCLTTGAGGMAVSANPELVSRMRQIRDGQPKANHRRLFSPLSDLASTLGLSQLARYHMFLDRRRMLAHRYQASLERIIPTSLQDYDCERSMFFRFTVKVRGGFDTYQEPFAEKGIQIDRGVDQLLHRLLDLSDEAFNISVVLFNETISLPIYPALGDEELNRCIQAAVNIFKMEEMNC